MISSFHNIALCCVFATIPQLICSVVLSADEVQRPNVVLIMTDDQGFGDLSSHGNPFISTPVQDALGNSGARFDRFFVSPVCAPTRASLLTGRYHLRTGVSGVTRGYENIRSEEITIAEVLKEAGYATACFGKWHNGRHMPMHPNGQGFETFFGFCGGHWNTYFNPPLEENGIPVHEEGYIADIFTDKAIEFMQASKDRPWFCYVAYNTPHSPWRVPQKYWEKYNGKGLDTKAQCAYAMVENIDENLGRILKYLKQSGAEKETIVIFLTDNGANSPRFNAGMKGYKGSVDEGGTRVPFFIRYPGVIEPGTVVKPIAFHLDVLPTLAELCHVELKQDHQKKLDGVSLVPLLKKLPEVETWPQRTLFTDGYRVDRDVKRLRGAVRNDQWRAVLMNGKWRLYEMQQDPGQTKNVAAEFPERLQEMSQSFEDWFASMDTESLKERQIPVGHMSRELFEIPANEADLVPGYGDLIKYTGDTTSGFANSWITEWASEEAYPTWPVDILEAGDYQVSIRYACARENVGCQLEVSIGKESQLVNVPVAHDPPLLSKPDYLYSNNYQDKESWANLNVGVFRLQKGEADLVVRLKSLTGTNGIELKSVILKRVNH
ncbi:sulfatase-like hydrolase/transferase [Thalassoglobus polymorphus]|uniref:Arylsulfatase n=1 Tax=Thalassoglobus polymorphus TaxID=2527994 RepID=A0A517QPK0_9PLAN|nr:sulfatase-like hydrolase/transferase [Thalassoglobus polymorphus]QDT33545.1 Arylsulfatase [Thalassoglobus polymorphus]